MFRSLIVQRERIGRLFRGRFIACPNPIMLEKLLNIVAIEEETMGAIDADAHVIETVQTWSYLEADERRFTPQLMTQTFGSELLSNEGTAMRDFWVIEGRAHGKDRNVGTDTSQESREMLSVEARLAHMDKLGIEMQVLYPTLF